MAYLLVPFPSAVHDDDARVYGRGHDPHGHGGHDDDDDDRAPPSVDPPLMLRSPHANI